MAKVSLALTSEVEIGKVDQILTVKSTNGRKIGALKFSKGSVEWWPKGNSVNAHKYTWEQLAAVLEDSKPTVRVAAKKAVKPVAKKTKPTVKRVPRTKPNAK
ncbi:hypothetical protein [Burkholderia pyrrocinia]|uniref:hypothetical protein n=1 Tax=Burkholderia pyrrocinia TaxID=60550 RepID=UPI001BCED4ED|nr:hypothetical protein [Burkholderia pyrrocinia]QVN19282.1 hypothetical protein JYG32_06015 [Burkholderia pyrrocinia]